MKKLLLLFLLVPSLLFAQKPEFFAGIEYYTSNQIILEQPSEDSYKHYDNILTYNAGELNLLIGVRYSPIKNLELKIRTDTYTDINTISCYSPVNAEYKVSAKYKILPKINLSVEHACFHPIESANRIEIIKHGGYTKFSLMYNLK